MYRPGNEYRCGRDFPQPPRLARGPPFLLYDGYQASFIEVEQSRRGVGHPPPSRAEVKESVELHFYSPIRTFLACFTANFAFTFSVILKHCKDTNPKWFVLQSILSASDFLRAFNGQMHNVR